MSLKKTGEFRARIIGNESCALCGLEARNAREALAIFVAFTPELYVDAKSERFVKVEQKYICRFCFSQILRDYFYGCAKTMDAHVKERPRQGDNN